MRKTVRLFGLAVRAVVLGIGGATLLTAVIVHATASFPGAVKSFTTKTDGAGQTIFAAHINDIQDEIVAIEGDLLNGFTHDLKFTDATYDIGKSGATRPRDLFLSRNLTVGGTSALGATSMAGHLTFTDATYDIGASGATRPRDFFLSRNAVVGGTVTGFTDAYTTDWTDYTASSTIVGWTSYTDKFILYKKVGKIVFVNFYIDGTSNSASVTFTLPVASASVSTNFIWTGVLGLSKDNNAHTATSGKWQLGNNSASVACYPSATYGSWTTSSTKQVGGQFWYQAAS